MEERICAGSGERIYAERSICARRWLRAEVTMPFPALELAAIAATVLTCIEHLDVFLIIVSACEVRIRLHAVSDLLPLQCCSDSDSS